MPPPFADPSPCLRITPWPQFMWSTVQEAGILFLEDNVVNVPVPIVDADFYPGWTKESFESWNKNVGSIGCFFGC